jgi:hypothetical protein
MELNKPQRKNSKKGSALSTSIINGDSIIPLEECKKLLGDYNLSDQRILNIRNNLIGIVDSVLNTYFEGFK